MLPRLSGGGAKKTDPEADSRPNPDANPPAVAVDYFFFLSSTASLLA